MPLETLCGPEINCGDGTCGSKSGIKAGACIWRGRLSEELVLPGRENIGELSLVLLPFGARVSGDIGGTCSPDLAELCAVGKLLLEGVKRRKAAAPAASRALEVDGAAGGEGLGAADPSADEVCSLLFGVCSSLVPEFSRIVLVGVGTGAPVCGMFGATSSAFPAACGQACQTPSGPKKPAKRSPRAASGLG